MPFEISDSLAKKYGDNVNNDLTTEKINSKFLDLVDKKSYQLLDMLQTSQEKLFKISSYDLFLRAKKASEEIPSDVGMKYLKAELKKLWNRVAGEDVTNEDVVQIKTATMRLYPNSYCKEFFDNLTSIASFEGFSDKDLMSSITQTAENVVNNLELKSSRWDSGKPFVIRSFSNRDNGIKDSWIDKQRKLGYRNIFRVISSNPKEIIYIATNMDEKVLIDDIYEKLGESVELVEYKDDEFLEKPFGLKGKKVHIIKGEHKGKEGIILYEVGYTGSGVVCKIKLDDGTVGAWGADFWEEIEEKLGKRIDDEFYVGGGAADRFKIVRVSGKKESNAKLATGEPDQDYNHEFFDEIVRQLDSAGFPGATHKEFDKYQGVYLNVPGVDKFWIKNIFYTGQKSKEDLAKSYTKAYMYNEVREPVSASRGDYFNLPEDHVFEGYSLTLIKQDGTREEIDNPKVSDLPDITEVMNTFTYEKGSTVEHVIFAPESNFDTVDIEITSTEDDKVDVSELIEYVKSNKVANKLSSDIRKAVSLKDWWNGFSLTEKGMYLENIGITNEEVLEDLVQLDWNNLSDEYKKLLTEESKGSDFNKKVEEENKKKADGEDKIYKDADYVLREQSEIKDIPIMDLPILYEADSLRNITDYAKKQGWDFVEDASLFGGYYTDSNGNAYLIDEVNTSKEEGNLQHTRDANKEASIESDELKLYIENDSELYERVYVPIIKNLSKKKIKGVYDPELAIKGFMYLVVAGAKKYIKDNGSPGDKWFEMFDMESRKETAKDFRDIFESQFENKEYDFMKEGQMNKMSDEYVSDEYVKAVTDIVNRVIGDKYSITHVEFSGENGIVEVNLDDYRLSIEFYYDEEKGWFFGKIEAFYVPEDGGEYEDAGELSGYFGTLDDLERTLTNVVVTLTSSSKESNKNKTALWKDRLQNVYLSLEEFKEYDRIYGLVERLGFESTEEAWEANPMIQGSVDPADYKVVKEKKKSWKKLVSMSLDKQGAKPGSKPFALWIDKGEEIEEGGLVYEGSYETFKDALNKSKQLMGVFATEIYLGDNLYYVDDAFEGERYFKEDLEKESMNIKSNVKLAWKAGDKVIYEPNMWDRMTSGVEPGDIGVITTEGTFKGIYADPARKYIMVEWEKSGREGVSPESLKKNSKCADVKSIFEMVKEKGIEFDNHESDLYIPKNEVTESLISVYDFKETVKTFRSQKDGKTWYDIPFAYDPFWEKKGINMNKYLRTIERFQKDAQVLGKNSNDINELKLWLEAAEDEKKITEIKIFPSSVEELEQRSPKITEDEVLIAKEATNTLKDMLKSVQELASKITEDELQIEKAMEEMRKVKEIDPAKALLKESIEKLTQMLNKSGGVVKINEEKVLALVIKSEDEPVLTKTVLDRLKEMKKEHKKIEDEYKENAGAQMKEIKRKITQRLIEFPLKSSRVAFSLKELIKNVWDFFTGWIGDVEDFGARLEAITW